MKLKRLIEGKGMLCALVFVAGPAPAFACKFLQATPEVLLERAEVAFVGTVERSSNGRSGQGASFPAVFKVESVRKGPVLEGQRLEVWSPNSSCGLDFTEGQRWQVFASGKPLESAAPSGSHLLSNGPYRGQ